MKVEIKKGIAERLKKRIEETKDFENVEEYINNILSQIVERLDAEQTGQHSDEDEAKVKEKLKSLGYLD